MSPESELNEQYYIFVAILVIRAKRRFLSQIRKLNWKKERIKGIFAFAESLPTSTTLLDADI